MGFVSMQEDIQDRRSDGMLFSSTSIYRYEAKKGLTICRKCSKPVYNHMLEQHILLCKGMVIEELSIAHHIREVQPYFRSIQKKTKRTSKSRPIPSTTQSTTLSAHEPPSLKQSPVRNPSEAIGPISLVMKELAKPGEWVSITQVMQRLQKKFPHFRLKDYGSRKFTGLFRVLINYFDLKKDKGVVYVRVISYEHPKNIVRQQDRLSTKRTSAGNEQNRKQPTEAKGLEKDFVDVKISTGIFRHQFDIGYCVEDLSTGQKFQCRFNESATRKIIKRLVERMENEEVVSVYYRASRIKGHAIALAVQEI